MALETGSGMERLLRELVLIHTDEQLPRSAHCTLAETSMLAQLRPTQ